MLLSGDSLSRAQTPEQLYQKDLLKAEKESKLQDAISLYDQIPDNSDASQSLRIKALLNTGICCERVGTQEPSGKQILIRSWKNQESISALSVMSKLLSY